MTQQSGSGGAGLTVRGALAGSLPAPTFANGSSYAPALTVLESKLAASLTIVNASTYYDGPSVVLAIGTWLVWAKALAFASVASSFVAVKLWDGATVYDSSDVRLGAGLEAIVPLFAAVVLAAPTTLKISAVSNVGSSACQILATIDGVTAEGANATRILAVRVL